MWATVIDIFVEISFYGHVVHGYNELDGGLDNTGIVDDIEQENAQLGSSEARASGNSPGGNDEARIHAFDPDSTRKAI